MCFEQLRIFFSFVANIYLHRPLFENILIINNMNKYCAGLNNDILLKVLKVFTALE